MNRSWIIQRLDEGSVLTRRLAREQADPIDRASRLMAAALSGNGRVLLFGNGGSAADAQHIAAELVGRFERDRDALPALALTTDTSTLTSVANDYGFEKIFARQVQAWGSAGDVAVAISTSGCSPNILAGVEMARESGMTTIGLTGGDGGQLASIVDIAIVVPSNNVARIQECHIAIGHILCEIVESLLFGGTLDQTVSIAPTTESIVGSKVVDLERLWDLRQQWQTEGRTVVWTNGCFDLLHLGHVRSLQAAKALGDVLVVGTNSDDTVQQLKGPGRPIMPAIERAEILAALACVDYVVVFHEPTPEAMLAHLKPDIHCKGGDYAPPAGKPVPEARVVESYGGRLEFLPLVPGISTSQVIQRIQERNKSERDGKG